MKVVPKKRLFWFLKEAAQFDLENQAELDTYVQQVLSRGKSQDIKELLKLVKPEVFRDSFNRVKNFLPKEIKMFWEKGFGDTNKTSKRDTRVSERDTR